LQQSWTGAVRRFIFTAATEGWGVAELPDLRGAARRTGGPRKRDLQFDVTVPKCNNRSGLARAVRMHGSGIGRAFFRADQAGTLAFRQQILATQPSHGRPDPSLPPLHRPHGASQGNIESLIK